MKRKALSGFFFLAALGLWQIVSLSGIWPRLLFPSPVEVGYYLLDVILDGSLIEATLVTLKRLALGYGCGLILGIPLGMLNARFQFLEDTLGVLALGFQTLPSICWAPLALLWFGQTETAMFFIVVMGTIWSIAIATNAGVRNVPLIYIRAARTLGSSGMHTWMRVILPASLPFILNGMKQGWAFAWRSLMAAEIYITILSGFGLGYMLHFNRELHAMDGVVGIIVVIIFIGLAINKLVFAPVEKFLAARWGLNKFQ